MSISKLRRQFVNCSARLLHNLEMEHAEQAAITPLHLLNTSVGVVMHREGQQWMSASATRIMSALQENCRAKLSLYRSAGEKNTRKAIWKD